MSTYAIGDIQGCDDALEHLLDRVNFQPDRDRVWFTGDIVNRGPTSLAVLRRIRDLDSAATMVLGNHDLHLLAMAHGHGQKHRLDTLDEVLAAPDRIELLEWLQHRPMLFFSAGLNYLLVHAGLAPQWNLATALRCAGEVEAVLRGPNAGEFFAHMYGNHPNRWDEHLAGWDRLRFITNCLTRMRYCDVDGHIDLKHKGAPGSQPPQLMPWYAVPNRAASDVPIVFGHWSTHGSDPFPHIHALDTGYHWGGRLSARRLEDGRIFSIERNSSELPG